MSDLPRVARLYVVGVLLAALIAGIAGVLLAPPRLALAPIALLLLLCATIAQQFKVKSTKHQSYYTTNIFFFAAANLFHPGYGSVIVLAARAVEWLRFGTRWYIQSFTVANFL